MKKYYWRMLGVGHLLLLIVAYWSCASTLPQKLGDKDAFSMIPFQNVSFQDLEKDISGLWEDLNFKGQKKNLPMEVF